MIIEHIESFICMEVVYGFAFNLSHAFFVCLKNYRYSNVKRIMWMNEVKYDRLMKFYSTNFSNFGRGVLFVIFLLIPKGRNLMGPNND